MHKHYINLCANKLMSVYANFWRLQYYFQRMIVFLQWAFLYSLYVFSHCVLCVPYFFHLAWFLMYFLVVQNILNMATEYSECVFLKYSEHKAQKWCITHVGPITALHLMIIKRGWQSQGGIRNNVLLQDLL